MHKYNPELAERAPFVWLSPSFCIERMERRAPPIYLDMRHFTPDKIQTLWESIPYAMVKYERAGILKGKKFVELIEYTPEGPRPMPSGVVTNRNYESRNISGLFAIGDATSQKAGVGLDCAAVSGVLAGRFVPEKVSQIDRVRIDEEQVWKLKKVALRPMERQSGIEPDHVILALQEAIHPYYVGIIRHEKRLKKALNDIEETRDNMVSLLHAYDPHYLVLANETRNMALCAEMFLRSALERKESRFGCLREDFRELDNVNWLKYIHLKYNKGKMKVWAEDVPIENYTLKPTREKTLHPFWKRVNELGYSDKVEE